MRWVLTWKRHFWRSAAWQMLERDLDHLFDVRRPRSCLSLAPKTPALFLGEDLSVPRVDGDGTESWPCQSVANALRIVKSSGIQQWQKQGLGFLVEASQIAEILGRLGDNPDACLAFFRYAAIDLRDHRHGLREYNAVLCVLAKFHRFQEIGAILDEMRHLELTAPDRSITVRILLACYGNVVVPAGKLLEALIRRTGEEQELHEMVEMIGRSCKLGWSLSMDLYEYCVNLLASNGFHNHAVEMRARIHVESKQDRFKIYKVGILALARAKRMDLAEELMKEMESGGSSPDFYVFISMVSGHCQANRPGDAIVHYERMIQEEMEPSLVVHNMMIDCLGKAGYVDRARTIFEEIGKRGLKPELVTYNSLLAVLFKNGKRDAAWKLFLAMKEEDGIVPDSVTYSILITHAGDGGDITEPCRLFLEMVDSGCSPDIVVHSTMVNLLFKCADVWQTLDFFKQMAQRGKALSVSVFTSLIFSYVRSGRMSSAFHLFRGLRDVSGYVHQRIYNALICGFANIDDVLHAFLLFKEMKVNSFAPDQVTYRTMVALLAKHAKLFQAQDVLDEMKANGITPDLVTYNKLMAMLGETGDLKGVFKLLQDLESQGLKADGYTYSALLHNLGRHRKVKTACKIFDELEARGHKPCAMTYNAYVGVLAMADMVNEANEAHRKMREVGLLPDLVTYDELIRLNERFNNEREVFELRSDMARRRLYYRPRQMPGIKDEGYIAVSRRLLARTQGDPLKQRQKKIF